jgi:6-pyruvoyl-tetrahydropterin synthase
MTKIKYALPKANILTGVGSFFCAAHRDLKGNLHGHTWEVTAWWSGTPDAVERQVALNAALKEFDHTVLDDSVAWGEKIGKALIQKLDCQKIEISRPLERIYAVIERA